MSARLSTALDESTLATFVKKDVQAILTRRYDIEQTIAGEIGDGEDMDLDDFAFGDEERVDRGPVYDDPVAMAPPPMSAGHGYGKGSGALGGASAPAYRDAKPSPKPKPRDDFGGGGIGRRKVAPSKPSSYTMADEPMPPPPPADLAAPEPMPMPQEEPLEVTAAALSIVVPSKGEAIRYEHLLLPAGADFSVSIRAYKPRRKP